MDIVRERTSTASRRSLTGGMVPVALRNLVDYGQVATIPDFGEESFYYVSGMHYRAAIGLARKEISHGRVLRQTQR